MGLFPRRSSLLCGVFAIAAMVTAVAEGCGDSPKTRALGDGCSLASDCTDPQVCAYARCHAQCAANKDCPPEQRCVGSQFPKTGVCFDQDACTLNSDCAAPLVCGRRARCEKQCSNNRDCLASQICSVGSCADPLDAPADAGPDSLGKKDDTCLYASDCQQPLVCKGGFCTQECRDSRDCLVNQQCVAGRCASGLADGGVPDGAPSGYGAPCSFTSQCASSLICTGGACVYECLVDPDCGAGRYCNELHRCIAGSRPASDAGADAPSEVGTGKACALDYECDDKVFCNGRERCLGGHCGPPSEIACDPHATCYVANCDEAARTCNPPTKVGTGSDLDRDGHIDKACGGDDCDDFDPTTYAGAPELCDGKDNDCNGKIDDYAVAPRGPVLTAPSATSHYGGGSLFIGTKGLDFDLFTDGSIGRISVWDSSIDLLSGGTTPMVKAFDLPYLNSSTGGIIATAGGPSLGAILYFRNAPGGAGLEGVVSIVGPDGSEFKTVVLQPTSDPMRDGDIVWTGSEWLLTWWHDLGGQFAKFAFLHVDGTIDIHTLPTADGSGQIYSGTRVVIGFSGAYVGIGYQDPSNNASFVVVSASGARLAGPTFVRSGGLAMAAAGTTTGFMFAYNDASYTRVAYVSQTGVLGAIVTTPIYATRGTGSFDGQGGILAMTGGDGLHMLYGRGALDDGVEHTALFTPGVSTLGDVPSVSVVSGKTFVSEWASSDQTARFVPVGCLPTP